MKTHAHTFSKLTPAEAVDLLGYTTIDVFEDVKCLYEYYRENNKEASRDYLWNFISLMTLMYNTGRVDGIREERARKTAK